ncbi:hypothetical protein GJ496_010248 [Pomphorhynchus laevis]|nr:hypothetical protein GJ496_010248 [Pomphorhynchus laevis]
MKILQNLFKLIPCRFYYNEKIESIHTSAENNPNRALHNDSTNANLVPACEFNADRIHQEITSKGLNNTPKHRSPVIVSSLTPTRIWKIGYKKSITITRKLLIEKAQDTYLETTRSQSSLKQNASDNLRHYYARQLRYRRIRRIRAII